MSEVTGHTVFRCKIKKEISIIKIGTSCQIDVLVFVSVSCCLSQMNSQSKDCIWVPLTASIVYLVKDEFPELPTSNNVDYYEGNMHLCDQSKLQHLLFSCLLARLGL